MKKSFKEILQEISEMWFLKEPLLFNVLCTHNLEENRNIFSMFSCGKGKILYNPDFMTPSTGVREISDRLKIEIIRITLKHPYERVPKNPNYAALGVSSDVTISDIMPEFGRYLLTPEYYNLEKGKSYEEYYNKLKYIIPENNGFGLNLGFGTSSSQQSSQNSQNDNQNGGQNDNQNGGQGNSQDSQNENGSSQDSEYNKLKKLSQYYKAAAMNARLWENDETMVENINNQIAKAAETNMWGTLPGNAIEIIKASMIIPMDYRKILSNFHASVLSQQRNLTRMKPNRRYGYNYMGSKYAPKTKLLVGVDVSGSISEEDIVHFFSIINRFFSYGVERIDVITFDSDLHDFFNLSKKQKKFTVTGRGGTNFQPVIDYFNEQNDYDGLIIFTDGYAPVPKIKAHSKVLWILSGKEEYENASEWIKKLHCKGTWIPSIDTKK